MLAFHGKKAIKKKYLDRVNSHFKADEIIKGIYWQNGKGCAVGCTVHSGDHSAYERELGIPKILARLEDSLFESLPNDLAKTWPLRFLKSIPVGADLSMVWPNFAIWLLDDPEFGAIQFAKTDAQREAIQSVADLYRLKVAGAEINVNDWLDARCAAEAAAYATAADFYIARTTAYVTADTYTARTAAYAADCAVDATNTAVAYAAVAAASAAGCATDAAYVAAGYDIDARTKFRIAQSEKLLELLQDTKKARR